jgi:uncharacterized membrane protein
MIAVVCGFIRSSPAGRVRKRLVTGKKKGEDPNGKRGLGWRTVQLVIGVISRPGIGDLLKTSHPTGFRQRLMQLRKEYQSVLCRRRRRRIAASHRQQNILFSHSTTTTTTKNQIPYAE